MRLVVIEGPDASGTTVQADAVAAALKACGVTARAFHHERPASWVRDPWSVALHYAELRAWTVKHLRAGEVLVCDRWWHTNDVEGCVLPLGARKAVRTLALAESTAPGMQPDLLIVLDADAEILNGRMLARGETPTAHDTERRWQYRESSTFEGATFVDASQPLEAVTARIVAEVLRAIGATA